MKRSLRWFRRARQTKAASGNRPRPYRPQLEQLDERLVPSTLSSAITIQHSGWTEWDWFTVDQTTGQVAEFQGTTFQGMALAFRSGPSAVYAVSASVEPVYGLGEVFALSSGNLWRWRFDDGVGGWSNFGGNYAAISATRDGHVYALTYSGDVHYVDSFGNSTDLGAPNTGIDVQIPGYNATTSTTSIAASVGWWGGNQVYVIDNYGEIYVNTANTSGQWQLVDNHQAFVSLSANANGTLYALSAGGTVFQETEHLGFAGWFFYNYWTEQNLPSNNTYFGEISADTDALGQDEVYAIGAGGNLYVYDQGSWTQKDSDVVDIAAAGGGYFYDVNYYGNYTTYAYQWNPYVGWTYLGSNLA